MINEDELHVTCGCHTHELHFEKDHEDPMWYVSFWLRGHLSENSWRFRLRQIWHILRKGTPYGDEVILERDDLVELQRYLDTQLTKNPKKKECLVPR